MGMTQSICRLLGCKTEDEEEGDEWPSNHYNFRSFIFKCFKLLWHKLRPIVYLAMPRGRAAQAILPVQKPSPPRPPPSTTIHARYGPSPSQLAESLLSSSPAGDRQLRCGHAYFWYSPEQIDQVTISIPGYCKYSLSREKISSASVKAPLLEELPVPTKNMGRLSEIGKPLHRPQEKSKLPLFDPPSQAGERRQMDRNEGSASPSRAPPVHRIEGKRLKSPSSSSSWSLSEARKREAEEKVIIKSTLVVNEGRWIKHYSSRHRMLLLGEGDFSFSACLALAFGCASNMVATSLDSEAFLLQNYGRAESNLSELRRRGCKVMHGVDATTMTNNEVLGHLKFDRIVFNFPFAGFFKHLSRDEQIRRHERLVSLFLKNAQKMISRENGEIHVTHKTNNFHVEWKVEAVASSHGLRLIEAVHFNHRDYRGYHTKCGFGGDNIFNCNPSKTYKFTLPY